MVNLELYRVFYTVAKCGSLTKAAQELYISQPAVSQAIRQLENQLGTTLFNRVHKGMELTKQGGELVFEDVSRALQLLDGVESRLSELKKSAKGTLRIGASETIFQYILADKLVKYHALYPDVKFELLSDVSPITIEQLKTDRCDVGFLNFPIPEDEGIVVRQTITLLNDVFIGGKGFERFRGRQVPLWELQNEPLLLMEPHTVARSAVDHFCTSLGIRFRPAIEVDSWGFMKNSSRKAWASAASRASTCSPKRGMGASSRSKSLPQCPRGRWGWRCLKTRAFPTPSAPSWNSFAKGKEGGAYKNHPIQMSRSPPPIAFLRSFPSCSASSFPPAARGRAFYLLSVRAC